LNDIASDLSGMTAVVTGAGSGIGAAIAERFAAAGARIGIVAHHDDAGAEATLAAVRKAGSDGIIVAADVGDPDDVDAIFPKVQGAIGTATILVNDAGIDALGKKVVELEVAEWERAIRTNLTGPFLCTRAFLRSLRQTDARAKIINISSIHEELPRAGAGEYCASKGGLRNLTRCLALELAPQHINVNAIAPGMILTPMNQAAIDDPKKLAADEATIPWKRAGRADEIAALALFLASSAADYVTGSTYVMDGGLMQNTGQGA